MHPEVASVRILFVCNECRLRSPSAAKHFSSLDGVETRCAGINENAVTKLDRILIEWADWILTMERPQRSYIETHFENISQVTKIQCLWIPDIYEKMDPELLNLLDKRVRKIIPLPVADQ